MAFIILEGIDRSGKSTVAEFYKKQGYKIIHMPAPSKKYYSQSYSGESYLEELVRLYSQHDGQNVVFDRSPYGELLWPKVFGRVPLLSEEDIEYLAQIENNNDPVRILMTDDNKEAHWQRCVDNKEPLTRVQFIQAGRLYADLAKRFLFEAKTIRDFIQEPQVTAVSGEGVQHESSNNVVRANESNDRFSETSPIVEVDKLQAKLERANAIRDLLTSSIVKKKGAAYSQLDKDIKSFLEKELESIFTEKTSSSFSEEEVQILKVYVKRIKEKMN